MNGTKTAWVSFLNNRGIKGCLKAIKVVSGATLIFALTATPVFASTIYVTPIGTVPQTNPQVNVQWALNELLPAGTFTGVRLLASWGSDVGSMHVELRGYTAINGGGANPTNSLKQTVVSSAGGTGQFVEFDFTSGTTGSAPTIDPAHYYVVSVYCYDDLGNGCSGAGNEWIKLWGAETYAGAGAFLVGADNLDVAHFEIAGAGGFDASSFATRIVNFAPRDMVYNPGLGSDTGDVDYDLDWYFNSTTDFGVYDEVCLEWEALEVGFSYVPDCFPITASGGATVSGTKNLFAGTHYVIAYFRKPDDTKGIAKGYTFTNMYSYVNEGQPIPDNMSVLPGMGYGTTTESTGFLNFLNVPELLRTKAPFSYFFQIKDLISSTSDVTATSTAFGTFNFAYATSSPLASLGTVTLFSTSTVTQLMPAGWLGIMRSLAVAVMYVSTGLFLFHDARRAITHHT